MFHVIEHPSDVLAPVQGQCGSEKLEKEEKLLLQTGINKEKAGLSVGSEERFCCLPASVCASIQKHASTLQEYMPAGSKGADLGSSAGPETIWLLWI